jgi:hypothetical protein
MLDQHGIERRDSDIACFQAVRAQCGPRTGCSASRRRWAVAARTS